MILTLPVVLLTSLLMTTIVAGMSTNNVFTVWILMEVNMVIFISLLTMTPNFAAPQTSFQYFVVQSVGSAIFFFAFCSLAKITSGLLFHLAVMSLLLKTGSFPFFQWYSSVMESCSWVNFLLLSSFQKALPLIMTLNFPSFSTTMSIAGNTVVALLLALSTSEIKKVLIFSSIFNMSWLIATIPSPQIFSLVLLAYTFASLAILAPAYSKNTWDSGSFLLTHASALEKKGVAVSLLSLGGFPPLIGFWAKISALSYLWQEGLFFIFALLLTSSVFIVFMYMNFVMKSLFGGTLTTSISSQNSITSESLPILLCLTPIFL